MWITSAPKSAKYIVAKGPGKSVEKSRTFNPFNAISMFIFSFYVDFLAILEI